MAAPFLTLPASAILVDAHDRQGPAELWRHSLGHGGINPLPLPEGVVAGVRRLQPRLIRTFIQEYFNVYPEHGRFDWSTLDPYMDSLARTGAKVVAAITIKPKPLFPTVDHVVRQPNDVAEWQQVVFQLVRRYSVERPIVTYWEVGNETDIGENGGSPYLIPDPEGYAAFYRMTVEPILEAFPAAKVGGPAACWIDNQPLPGLVEYCGRTGTQLDFISRHLYSSDPRRHALGVEKAKRLLDGFPGKRPEMLITEWSKGFERVADAYDPQTHTLGRMVSVEEMAYEPRRAAITAASILAMRDAGLDWSFYYHIWDQVFYVDAFRPFFSQSGLDLMVEHWNQVPHRFGLFGVGEEVRPQYFVYQLLGRLGEERVAVQCDEPDLHVLATCDDRAVSTFIANFNSVASRDRLATLHYEHLDPGPKMLTTYRVDRGQRGPMASLDLDPIERRPVDTAASFRCQVYLPGDSVALVRLEQDRLPVSVTR